MQIRDDLANATCAPCDTGSYFQNIAEPCSQCPSGQYQDEAGMTGCRYCTAGKFARGPGNSTCDDCSQGYFSKKGVSECDPCSIGQYQAEAGKDRCFTCEDAKTVASTECDGCPPGQFNSSSGSCKDCPAM